MAVPSTNIPTRVFIDRPSKTKSLSSPKKHLLCIDAKKQDQILKIKGSYNIFQPSPKRWIDLWKKWVPTTFQMIRISTMVEKIYDWRYTEAVRRRGIFQNVAVSEHLLCELSWKQWENSLSYECISFNHWKLSTPRSLLDYFEPLSDQWCLIYVPK